jgi:hypothetical protein
MSSTLTIRLSAELAEWLKKTSIKRRVARGCIVREELERARKQESKPWMRLAGDIKGGPRDVSMRKGFSPK